MSRFLLEGPPTVHNLLFCAHRLCMSYVTKTFLLISFSINNHCVLYTVKVKKENKNTQQKTLLSFISIYLYYYYGETKIH